MTNVSFELLINCQSTQETFKVKIACTETTTRLSTVVSTVDSAHHSRGVSPWLRVKAF